MHSEGRAVAALLRRVDRWALCRSIAACETCVSGRVERGSQRIVQRLQPDLVARGDRPACPNDMGPGSAFLRVDDRPQNLLDRRVETLDQGMAVVEAASIHTHRHFGPRGFDRVALHSLDRIAVDLAVEMASAWTALEAGERGFVRSAAGADHQAPAPSRPWVTGRNRLCGAPDDDVRHHSARDANTVVEENRALRIGIGRGESHQRKRLAGKLQIQLSVRILDHRPQLDEVCSLSCLAIGQ